MSPSLPFSRSLLYPLTAVLILLAVVPVASVGLRFVAANREQVSTLEKLYLTRQAVGLARELHLTFLDSLARLDTLSQTLRPQGRVGFVPDAAKDVLAEVVRANGSLIRLAVLDTNGQGPYVQARQLPPGPQRALDVALGSAFADSQRGQAVRRDFMRLAGTPPVAIISLPVLGSDGGVAGVLQAVVSLEWVSERLAEEASRGVTVDVVGRDGQVLFSSNPRRVGVSARLNPLVSQFTQAAVRLTKTYEDPLSPSGGEVLGSLCPVEEPAWAVVTSRGVAVAFAAVRAMAERTALLTIIAGLIATLAGVMLARRITLPLRHLAGVTTAVAHGDFATRVPVTSRNELGRLADNFNTMAAEIEQYVSSLRDALRENQELLVDAIRSLSAAIDAKNPYTRGHSERVSQYSVAVARELALSSDEIKRVEISALLHDVGKIGIEDAILTKPGTLTETEFHAMRDHPVKGAAIVSSIRNLRDILPGIRSHHENWDGGGYPDGLKGEDIPLVARIIAAADVFDAMTTTRPYQKALSLEFVFQRMRDLSGKRLDPRVTEAFFSAIRSGELVPRQHVEVA
jgi:HD-GYP domain-containing protein (c-di-GMP phosphodiesterase class II)